MPDETFYLRFADLEVGDHFRFLYNVYTNPRLGDDTLVKTNRFGWYRFVNKPSHAWHTSTHTAVVRVTHIVEVK